MNDDGLSQGFAFHLTDLLKHTSLDDTNSHESLFSLRLIDLEALDQKAFAGPGDWFQDVFAIPPLELSTGVESDVAESFESADLSIPSQPLQFQEEGTAIDQDIWTLEVDANGNVGSLLRLLTWDAFENDSNSEDITHYLSESNENACNLALQHLQGPDAASGVLPQHVMLQPLCNLVIGRPSIFFQWSPIKEIFEPTVPDVPISGYSMACQTSFLESLIRCGSCFRRLLEYGSNHSSRRACPTIVALKAAVITAIDQIEHEIAALSTSLRSMLELQALIFRPSAVLQLLDRLVQCTKEHDTEELILSALSDEITIILQTDHSCAAFLQELLARVSEPWLQSLCSELSLGATQNGVVVPAPLQTDQDDDQDLRLAFQGNGDSVRYPSFLTDEDCQLIREMRASLKALRIDRPSSLRGVPATGTSSWLATPAPCTDIHHAWSSQTAPASHLLPSEQLAWTQNEQQHDYLAWLAKQMSQSPKHSQEDRLGSALHQVLHSPPDNPKLDERDHFPLQIDYCDPWESVRIAMHSHASDMNKAMLRCIFQESRLLLHLHALRDYFLFGSGAFTQQLCIALFSTETQTAQRTRGNIPTADAMGLRLGVGGDQRWPPASSEMHLSLVSVLADAHVSPYNESDRKRLVDDLPGGIGFTVRELSDSEIDKVSDPGSIQALDFIKLQYTAPPHLQNVLNPARLKVYDDAFRFLLKLLRASHVTETLRRTACIRKPSDRGDKALNCAINRFTMQAHHFVSVLRSHILHVGIETLWSKLLQSMEAIERSLNSEEDQAKANHVGPDHICALHEAFLSEVRSRLFLRRRQGKIHESIENALTSILHGAVALETHDGAKMIGIERDLEQNVQEVLVHLQAAASKSIRSGKANEKADEESEAIEMLQLKLNWNEYYK